MTAGTLRPASIAAALGMPALLGSRRVLVGHARQLERRGGTLDGLVPQGRVRFLDAAELNGQLVEELRRETPDEVYFDLHARLDEQMMAQAGARLLMDGTAVHFVFSRRGRPPVRAVTTSIGSESVISLYAVREPLVLRALRRLGDIVGSTMLLVIIGLCRVTRRGTAPRRKPARMELRSGERRSLARDLAILVRTVPAVIRQRRAL